MDDIHCVKRKRKRKKNINTNQAQACLVICGLPCSVEAKQWTAGIIQKSQRQLLWRDLRLLVGSWPGMNKVILTSHYDVIIRHQFGTKRWKNVPSPPPLRNGQYDFFSR